MYVRALLKEGGVTPSYATFESAGADIVANKNCEWTPLKCNDIVIGWKAIVSTGLYLQIPTGYEMQVRPRSGLAFNYSVSVLNAPGTIDADYRGEIKVCLVCLGDLDTNLYLTDVATEEEPNPAKILPAGMKVAQAVFSSFEKVKFAISDNLSSSIRGEDGIGSTGLMASTDVKLSVEFNVGDIHLIDITMGTLARLVKSLEDYNKDFLGISSLYESVPDSKMIFVTYDVYEFDYNKQELFQRILSAVDLLGGRDLLEDAYNRIPEKSKY